jgi:hypothetical protein
MVTRILAELGITRVDTGMPPVGQYFEQLVQIAINAHHRRTWAEFIERVKDAS